ncbi:MAG: ribosome recycling factor [Gemmatimonadota bacterium]|nr:ribosome recycling factor [Gemmatimonadota bacterium]MDH3428165.1 ribosome recycling factor [Gemmatimonadota bacterium]
MSSQALKEASSQMDRNLEAIAREFSGVRTGKASPAILDLVQVPAYGSVMPLKQTATVTAPEAQMLVVQPWDTSLVGTVAKAIQAADLGLNPSVDGNLIRVAIPALTEERRREMVKLLHRMAEEGRIAVRHARHRAKAEIEREKKDGEVSEDEMRRDLDALQNLTDEHIAKLDELLARKETEVMEV